MRHDSMHRHSRQDEERCAALQRALDESSFPASSVREVALSGFRLSELVEQCMQHIGAYCRGEPSTDVYGVELLRRATVEGEQEAWTSFQQCLGEVVSGWLRRHPRWDAAARLDSEEHYVAQAFTRFWQATTQQRLEFHTLAAALRYLRASLNGALLDALRAYSRLREVTLPEPGDPREPAVENCTGTNEIWEILRTMLPGEREQRLAFLLFHCGLDPREIVRFCPQEWNSVQEINRLRHNILERLLHYANQLAPTAQSPSTLVKKENTPEQPA